MMVLVELGLVWRHLMGHYRSAPGLSRSNPT
jgi:hypothetical protein